MKQCTSPNKPVFKRLSATVGALITLVIIVQFTSENAFVVSEFDNISSAKNQISAKSTSAVSELVSVESSMDLANWLNEWRMSPGQALLDQGRTIAESRRARMSKLIQTDPGLAIDSMLPYQDYLDLPQEVSEIIEKPFAVVADVDAVTVCGDIHEVDHENLNNDLNYFAEWDSTTRQLFIPEERKGLLSKSGFPLVGIELDGLAAIHRESAISLSDEDRIAATSLFKISTEQSASASTLLVGNKILEAPEYHSTNSLNEILAFAEKQIGPETTQSALAVVGSENKPADSVYDAVLQSSVAWTLGSKKVLLIRLAFSDVERSVRSREEFQDWLHIVSDQFEEMSFGQTRFSVMDVSEDVYTLPLPSKSYKNSNDWFCNLHSDAVELVAQDGITVSDYDIVVVVTPHFGTTARGLATVGGTKQWFRDEPYGFGYSTMRHEFGHNYGLQHAGAWDSDDGTILPPTHSSKHHIEYGDVFDHMGSGGMGDLADFNVFEKSRLDWVDEAQIQVINDKIHETFRVYGFDTPDAIEIPLIALKIQYKESQTFWVMYRCDFTSNEFLKNGAYVIWQYQWNRARLLDMTPQSQIFLSDLSDSALIVGSTFIDPTEAIKITTVGQGSTNGKDWLDIEVEIIDTFNNAPRVRLGRPSNSVEGNTTRFHAIGFDLDGDKLVYYWDFGDGAKASSTTGSMEHTYQSAGTYTVNLEVIDSSGASGNSSILLEVSARSVSFHFEEWFKLEIPYADLTREDLLPESDYDRDGFSNLMEYGLGMNPSTTDRADILKDQLAKLLHGESIELLLRSDDSALVAAFYLSYDLKNWEPVPVFFDKASNSWYMESDILELVGEKNEGEGLWRVEVRIRENVESLFLKFGVSYDSEYDQN